MTNLKIASSTLQTETFFLNRIAVLFRLSSNYLLIAGENILSIVMTPKVPHRSNISARAYTRQDVRSEDLFVRSMYHYCTEKVDLPTGLDQGFFFSGRG